MKQHAYLPCLPEISWYLTRMEFGLDSCYSGSEPFEKQTTRNRFSILTANGIQWLTIPVESTHGKNKPYSEIKISSEFRPKKILTAIQSAYGKSAYYDFVMDDLNSIFYSEEKMLFDFNQKLFAWTLTWCKNDFKNTTPKCLGEEIEKIDFEFHSYLHVFSDRFSFQPNLSILDVIFNKGRFDLNQLGCVKKS
jgi:WbqC-like protein family